MTHTTLTTILICSDLTDESDLALQTAQRLAARTGAQLHLVHAISPPGPYWEVSTSSLDTQRWTRDAREKLTRQAERVLGSAEGVTIRAAIETPYKVIVETAEQVNADLIVLGPHRQRPGAVLTGTTADRVLQVASVPCLVANGSLPDTLPRVRVALDLSNPARGALRLAAHWLPPLISDGGTIPLEVMHVAPVATAFGLGSPDIGELEKRLREEVDAVFGEVHPEHLDVSYRVARSDQPAPAIAEQNENGPDLIVVSTRGMGTVGRALVGGTASRVVRRATGLPVLLVPPSMWRTED